MKREEGRAKREEGRGCRGGKRMTNLSLRLWGGGGETAVKRRQIHEKSTAAAVVKWWQNCGKMDKNAIYEF